MAAGPVYRECGVTSKAVVLTQGIHPAFQPSAQDAKSGRCYSAELEFVIGVNGLIETKTARVVRTNSQPLAEAIISMLPQLKFQPARLNDETVRQIMNYRQVVKTRVVIVPAGTTPSAPAGSTHGTPGC